MIISFLFVSLLSLLMVYSSLGEIFSLSYWCEREITKESPVRALGRAGHPREPEGESRVRAVGSRPLLPGQNTFLLWHEFLQTGSRKWLFLFFLAGSFKYTGQKRCRVFFCFVCFCFLMPRKKARRIGMKRNMEPRKLVRTTSERPLYKGK